MDQLFGKLQNILAPQNSQKQHQQYQEYYSQQQHQQHTGQQFQQQQQQYYPQQQTLPPGWTALFSAQYNSYYYYNSVTGETQWTHPIAQVQCVPDQLYRQQAYQQQPYQQQAQQPQTHQQLPLQQQFVPNGRKKALLVGINYTGSKHALAGCINDALNLREFISQNYGYPTTSDAMLLMTDDHRNINPRFLPTSRNLLAAFYWLVSGSQPGDQLFFSYSGHGGQIPDDDGDRESGLDSTICPLDFESVGQIRSDDLHRYLVAALPHGVKLTVIMDCCHSGTVMELPYTYRPDENGKMSQIDFVKKGAVIVAGVGKLLQGGFSMNKLNDAKLLFSEAKSLASMFEGGDSTNEQGYKQESFNENSGAPKQVFCLSGCQDVQTSADTSFNGQASGALTYAVLNTLQGHPQLSYEQLLMRLRGFMKGKFSQVPQLSCGIPANPNSLFTI
ncbi:hypothetical protein HK100_011836 [Physocladia obscura]|uniref:WW domain-containing protein n=1 Tax=Physocladia obscura TaxID=109957 RepID=A0AAD5T3J8_9FUNG|nr:hypothetical protein HK100_011836 [Physocladia obscura]